MTEMRTKDRLFLAVVVPLALLAAYWYGWRAAAGRQIAELGHRQESLVAEGDFQQERLRADRQLAEARAELETERKIPPPQATMKADAEASAAMREFLALQVLREAGLRVVGSTESRDVRRFADDASVGRAGELLRATGVRPDPIRRSYTVDGRYPDVVKALKTFAERQMAVIPDCVLMRDAGRSRWTLEVWQ